MEEIVDVKAARAVSWTSRTVSTTEKPFSESEPFRMSTRHNKYRLVELRKISYKSAFSLVRCTRWRARWHLIRQQSEAQAKVTAHVDFQRAFIE